MRVLLRQHRDALLAALGLVAPACGRDAPLDDPTMDGGPLDGSDARDARTDAPDGTEGADAAGEDAATPPTPCPDARPVLQADGTPSGLVVCPDDRLLRHEPATCVDPTPRGGACRGACAGCACETDDDCSARPHGRCVRSFDPLSEDESCGCTYGCATDADCGGGVCLCAVADEPRVVGGPHCVRATCQASADCPTSRCALGAWNDDCSIEYVFACTTGRDECEGDETCPFVGAEACFPWRDDVWTCNSGPVCGRPFVVDGVSRSARSRVGPGWTDGAGRRDTLDSEAAAVRWEAMARLEHASIASFARFTLGLMQHGAPADLLAAGAAAMADEVDHARRCYAIASAHAGEPLAPGPLDTSGGASAPSLRDLLLDTAREGCVGETLGALEAAWRVEHTVDPVERETLEVIARDELRHAELAWRTLQWGLARPGAPTYAEVESAVESALASFTVPPADDSAASVSVSALFRAAADSVVRSCLAGLRLA